MHRRCSVIAPSAYSVMVREDGVVFSFFSNTAYRGLPAVRVVYAGINSIIL